MSTRDKKRFLAIVDPWQECDRTDAKDFPHFESDSTIQCQLIHNQLSRLRPLFDDVIVIDSYREINPIFNKLPSVGSVLNEYLDERPEWDMWLCGFHYGMCIHHKIDEVIKQYGWEYSRFNIIQNLSFIFPASTKNIILKYYGTSETVLNTKEYYWDYRDSLTEL